MPTTATPRTPRPAYPGLFRATGLSGLVAGTLVVASQLVGLTMDRDPAALATTALTGPATVFVLTKLLGFVLLPLALVGAHLHQGPRTGRLGVGGLVAAVAGTTLTAGDWWFEAFAVTWLARSAPELLLAPPPVPMTLAAATGFVLLASGTVVMGAASLRARVLPRWAGLLLVVAGALSLMAGYPPFLLPLGCAVAVVGWLVLRGPALGPVLVDPVARPDGARV